MKKLYEGKTKILFLEEETNEVIMEFKDSITAFNSKKMEIINGKGKINLNISTILFDYLAAHGIKTHFINLIDSTKLKVINIEIIPFEVVVRNVAAGSLTKHYNIAKGTILNQPVIEFFLKNDALNDPLLNDDHIKILNVLKKDSDLIKLKELSLSINDLLKDFFIKRDLILVDIKLEFGYNSVGDIILADELSPDNYRLWDKTSGLSYDKDIFREGSSNILEPYQEVLSRCEQKHDTEVIKHKFNTEIIIQLRKDILDPEGKAVENSLKNLGFAEITNVRMGKLIKFNIYSNYKEQAKKTIEKACQILLANPVIEDYDIKVLES